MYKNKLKKEVEVINSVLIDNNLREVLKSIFVQNLSPYDNREKHLLFSYQKVVSKLPPTILSSIRDFKCRTDASPVLLIRNLPIDDDLPETPHDAKRSLIKKSFVSESCLTGFSQLLGDVYGYIDEKKGELIHNVCPVKSQESKNYVSESSIRPLPFHTEYSYFDFRPDYLSLYCLRSDQKQRVATTIVYVRDLVNKLSSKETEILRKPLFSFPYFEKVNDEIL
jgi:L-asparagine oxygenase